MREDAKPDGGSELEPDGGTVGVAHREPDDSTNCSSICSSVRVADREPVHVADDGTDRVAEHEPDREPDRSANEQPDERADRARLRRQEHRR